jgi:hypothetical protein
VSHQYRLNFGINLKASEGQSPVSVELNPSFFGSLIFFGMNLYAKVQDWLSSAFGFVAIKLILLFVKIFGEKREGGNGVHAFHLSEGL